MVKLTVYASAGDFDLSRYSNVDKRIVNGDDYYYTNTDQFGATMFSTDIPRGAKMVASPLYFGQAIFPDGFAPDGMITGRIGDDKLAEWLEDRNLDDYTPDTLIARIFVGADHLRGNTGNDLLDGHAGADTLLGEGGDDTLMGGVGDDILVGGFGADTLIGGFGADHFVVRQRADLFGGTETVSDFSHADGDKIDLTRFDASVQTAGQQSVTFIGEAAFGAIGVAEVRVEATSPDINTLQFDTNGDGKVDAVLTVHTTTVLDATDVETTAPLAKPLSIAAAFGGDTVAVQPVHGPHFQHVELAHGVLA